MPETPVSPLWTAEDIVRATGGQRHGADFAVDGVAFDSREIEPGKLFVALRGARDGHDFAGTAFEAGAAGALVERVVDGGPCITVTDTLKALEALGQAARDRSSARRAAVTGSVGKTSVTQAIKAGLDLAGPAHASVKSYNNHIGVPLTLARMPRDTERAVFEIGMNAPGEIAPLSKMVRPHVACVTTVGPVHIEAFADGEAGVAREKAAIFEGLEPGGVAVINGDNPWTRLLAEVAREHGAEVRLFGSAADHDARLLDFEPDAEGATVSATLDGQALEFRLRQSGYHWGLNSLAVLTVLRAMDVPLDTALEALAGFSPLAGRGQVRQVRLASGGTFTLIDESYNANPLSMTAGFRSLGARIVPEGGRRVVFLTDMLELGDQAEAMHAGLAEPLDAARVDVVHTAGPMMRHLHEALPPARRGVWRETAAMLADEVAALVRDGDTVMVKGSNGSRAGQIATALAGLHSDDGA